MRFKLGRERVIPLALVIKSYFEYVYVAEVEEVFKFSTELSFAALYTYLTYLLTLLNSSQLREDKMNRSGRICTAHNFQLGVFNIGTVTHLLAPHHFRSVHFERSCFDFHVNSLVLIVYPYYSVG